MRDLNAARKNAADEIQRFLNVVESERPFTEEERAACLKAVQEWIAALESDKATQ